MTGPTDDPRTPSGTTSSVLGALGFGPDALLMNDPKLFVDRRFLAALLVELDSELGPGNARTALFHIGLMHGFRDAFRIAARAASDAPSHGAAGESISLVMQLGTSGAGASTIGAELVGHWPETHEAQARLARSGATAEASCFLSAGYTSGWLSGTQDRDLIVVESACAATGAERCCFRALEIADWSALPEGGLIDRLELPPFEDLRALAQEAAGGRPSPARPVAGADAIPPGQFDPEDDAVHIWGPVMVLPFTSVEEVLATVDMLSTDPNTCSIRVVVIDLRNQLLDDDLGAAGLERVLETIESWGAEVLLTGVSPLAEATLADLEASHLLTRKELPDAIATAFQIAEAQRHLL